MGGKNVQKENDVNLDDGLSEYEMQILDTNKDGLVTEEEFKAVYGNNEKTATTWNTYLTAFNSIMQQKPSQGIYISNDSVQLCSNKNGYLNNTVKNNIEKYMPKDTKTMNLEQFYSFLKTDLGLSDLSDSQISKVFDTLIGLSDIKTNTLSAIEIASLLALADMGEKAENYSIGTLQIDQMNGSFSKQELKTAIANIVRSDKNSLANLKKLHDTTLPVGFNSVSKNSSNNETKQITYTKKAVESEEKIKQQRNNSIDNQINNYKQTMDEEIKLYQQQINAMQKCTDKDYKNEIESLRGKISKTKELYQEQINSLENQKAKLNIHYDANILILNYRHEETKQGKTPEDVDYSNLINELETLYTNNETVSEFKNIDISNIKTEISKLIQKYPSMEKQIKIYVKNQLKVVKKRIENNIKNKIEEAETNYNNQKQDENLSHVKSIANLTKDDKDKQSNISQNEAPVTSDANINIFNTLNNYLVNIDLPLREALDNYSLLFSDLEQEINDL